MSVDQLIAAAVENGGLLGFALASLWMLNRVWADRVSTEKTVSEKWKILAQQNQTVIKENTRAITQLIEMLRKE